MKRSQANNVIARYLYELNVEPEDCDTEAIIILNALEQLGMAPPEYLPEPQYCEVTGKQLECKPVRKWEKE